MDDALGQRARDKLLGLKLLLSPKRHDVPELERLDLMSRSHVLIRLTFAPNRARLRWLTEVHRFTHVGLGRAVRTLHHC